MMRLNALPEFGQLRALLYAIPPGPWYGLLSLPLGAGTWGIASVQRGGLGAQGSHETLPNALPV